MSTNKVKIIKEGISSSELPNGFEPLARKLTLYCQKKLGFENPPALFLKRDDKVANDPLGQTAEYNPMKKAVTIYITGRHTKDILRSLAHELVHHQQNMRGDLSPGKCGSLGPGYAQTNKHMRNMEKEAYLMGNIIFRDWEDQCKNKENFLKENIKMDKNKEIKISKKVIKNLIQKVVKAKMQEMQIKVGPGPINPVSVVGEKCAVCGAEKVLGEGGCGHDAGVRDENKYSMGEGEVENYDLGEGTPYDMSALGEGEMDIEGIVASAEGNVPAIEVGMGEGAADYEIGEGEIDAEIGEGEIDAELGESTPQYDNDPALTGDQDELPDHLQKAIINKKGPGPKNESFKVTTPEQENMLYESRFGDRNDQLFQKLSKLWTK